jgi:hypothetical protein
MKLIIEARFEDSDGQAGPAIVVGEMQRLDGNINDLGLTLAEGRNLLGQVQFRLVSQQVQHWLEQHSGCHRCGQALAHKDTRSVIVRTVFGKIAVPSPRWWSCRCGKEGRRHTFSPLCKALTRRTTLELECLQAKWAAHLPYRQANSLLKEVLPLNKAMSFGGTRRRVLAVGHGLDQQVQHDIAQHRNRVHVSGKARESKDVACVAVDSAWLTLYVSPKSRQAQQAEEKLRPLRMKQVWAHHVNIVAGRATFARRSARVYGYVHKEVDSAADRLDQFLRAGGVRTDERVTVISDDAGEFVKAVRGSELARGRILDWFHIAMKFKAAQNSVRGSKLFEPHERDMVCDWLRSAEWLVWHGKGRQAVARIKGMDEELLARPGHEDSTLWWNLRRLYYYIDNNESTLVNYGARYRKGLPISSSIAESAVNLLVSHRMAKKQQMRWTNEGAHQLVQVRVAALNGELTPKRLAALSKMNSANASQTRQVA